MQHVKLVAGTILLLLIVIFTVQNASVVTINFLLWKFSISRALMIFLVLATGIALGLIFSAIIKRHKHK